MEGHFVFVRREQLREQLGELGELGELQFRDRSLCPEPTQA